MLTSNLRIYKYIHVSAISKACFQQIPGRVTQGRLSNEGNFTKLNPNCRCAKVRGPGCPFPLIAGVNSALPERILQTLPNKKEYTGRVLIKASTLKCLRRNFPKTQSGTINQLS